MRRYWIFFASRKYLRVFGPMVKSSSSSEKPNQDLKYFAGEAKMRRVFVVQQKLT